ncbi:hypothetical protein [Penaeicola halotolerans]|uniref:hypothetical protein n=1 Tax=Penaeicola halotolerans TaxID=2793196 RepID=UPI001CF8FBB9|nr:hypothetical protein [Penaeicola halotolerans]
MSWTKEPSHTKVIGIIFIVRAVLYLLGGVFIIAFMPMLEIFTEEVIANDPDAKIPLQFFEVIAQFGLGICLVFTVLNLITGIGILKATEWGRIMGIVLSALAVFNFPIGTILGVYSLMYLADGRLDQKETMEQRLAKMKQGHL